jgi:hypothetical protein
MLGINCKASFPGRFSQKLQMSNLMKIRPVECELFLGDRTDRQTERHMIKLFAILRVCLIRIKVLWAMAVGRVAPTLRITLVPSSSPSSPPFTPFFVPLLLLLLFLLLLLLFLFLLFLLLLLLSLGKSSRKRVLEPKAL